MDKLFGIFKKKDSKIERPEVSFDGAVETPESLSVIGNIRRYGLRSARNLFFGIGMMTSVERFVSSTAEDISYEIEDYNSPYEQAQRTIDDYKDVLSPEEYLKFKEFTEHNYVGDLSKESYQENIQKISEDFPMNAADLVVLGDPLAREAIDTLTHDPELWKAMLEIKTAEKEGFQADFSIVPVRNISFLRDRKYVENMKRLMSLGVNTTNSNPRILEDSIYQELKRVSSLGKNITFRGDVVYFSGRKLNLDLYPNIKNNLENSVIDNGLLYPLSNPDDAMLSRWEKFFSEEKNEAIFSILRNEGYAVSSFTLLGYQLKELGPFFQDEENIKALLMISDKVQKNDLRGTDVGTVINFIRDSYNSNDTNSVKEMLSDLVLANKSDKKIPIQDFISNLRKIGIHQNIYLPLIKETPKEDRLEDAFFQDPALQIVRALGYHKHAPKILHGMNQREQASWIMQTCRLMQTTGAKNTEESFNHTLRSIMETRSNPEILNKEVFKGRDVVMMAHNETYESFGEFTGDGPIRTRKIINVDRFGKDSVISGIKNQHPQSMEFFKASGDLHDLESKRRKFIHCLETSKKLTVYIDAHGSENAVFFSDGLPDNKGRVDESGINNSVDFQEIGKALINRFNSGITDRAIIIDDACMNFKFLQNIYDYIRVYNQNNNMAIPLPIGVGMSEMGQYGFSNYDSPYGSMFSEDLLKSSKDKTLILKDILEIEHTGTGMLSNISVFVPQSIEQERWVFVGEDKSSKYDQANSKKFPKNATGATTTTKTTQLDNNGFQKKKVKIEVPFQIAENEKKEADFWVKDEPQG